MKIIFMIVKMSKKNKSKIKKINQEQEQTQTHRLHHLTVKIITTTHSQS